MIKPEDRTAAAVGPLITGVQSELGDALQKGLSQRDVDPLLEHSTQNADMVLIDKEKIEQGVVLTLDEAQLLESILVWNYNRPSYTDWGVAQMDVSVWTEDGGWKSLIKDVELLEGEGTTDYDEPTLLTFEPVQAKKVRFENLRSFNAETQQIGLSAVQLYGPLGPTASDPAPQDGREVSYCDLMSLGWKPGRDAVAHDVYVGDSAESLKLLGRVKGAPKVQVSGLSAGNAYAWRIDEVSEDGTVEAGAVWSFTTKGSQIGHWPLDGTTEDLVGNRTGVIAGEPTWEDGVRGKALRFDGQDDAVEIEALNLNTETVTMCAWIKPEQEVPQISGVVFCRAPHTVAGIHLYQDQLRYHWNDHRSTWGWDSGLEVPLGRNWTFVALTVEPEKAVLYAGYMDSDLLSAVNHLKHGPEEFDGTLYFGRDLTEGRYFNGLIDDVQIFDFALSTEQIKQVRDGQTLDMSGTGEIALVGADLVEEGDSLKDIAAEAKAQDADEAKKRSNLPAVLVIVGIVLAIAVVSAVRKKK